MDFANASSIAKDVIVALAAAVTAFVAYSGLNTWRRQLNGNAVHEIGRKMLKSVYLMREELQSVRAPLVTPNEFREALLDNGYEDNGEEPALHPMGRAAVFAYRWKRVAALSPDLMACRVEAEALWGEEFRVITKELDRSIQELGTCLYMFQLSEQEKSRTGTPYEATNSTKFQKTLWCVSVDDDPYAEKLESAIKSIEAFIRPKMGLHL